MPETAAIRSARGHVEMYEASIARRKAELESGQYQVSEAQTRDWLRRDEEELALWKRYLQQAERDRIAPPLA